MSVALADMPLFELKARQRELTNRWFDEDVAGEDEKRSQCLEEGCDNRCVKTICAECLRRKLEEANAALGARNRELLAPMKVSAAAHEEEEPDDGADAGGEEEGEEAEETAPMSNGNCTVCGGELRANNKIGICTRTPECKRAAANARYAAKGGKVVATSKAAPPSRPSRPPAPRSVKQSAGRRDLAGPDLASIKERARAEYEAAVAEAKRIYEETLAAIATVERLAT